ncbi:MAG: hypothetical protein WBF46_03705 [Candidatus Acidiferrales bacterium]
MRARYGIFVRPVSTFRGLVSHWAASLYDGYYGIETDKRGYQAPPAGESIPYDPAEPKYLRQVFRLLSALNLKEFTFVDFGSGKGRVLVAAASHAFKTVIGVELCSDLHLAAVKNISKARRLRCQSVVSVNMDARDFSIPQTPCVLFFYNPFIGAIMEKVLSNIRESLRAHPRPAFVIYLNPRLHEAFMRKNGVELVRSVNWCNFYRWDCSPLS